MGRQVITTTVLYALADAFDTKVRYDRLKKQIDFTEVRRIKIGDITVTVPLDCVSNVTDEKWVAVLVQSLGNLAFLAISAKTGTNTTNVVIAVLDLAKLDGPAENYLERADKAKKADSPTKIMALVKHATVEVFHRSQTEKWKDLVA